MFPAMLWYAEEEGGPYRGVLVRATESSAPLQELLEGHYTSVEAAEELVGDRDVEVLAPTLARTKFYTPLPQLTAKDTDSCLFLSHHVKQVFVKEGTLPWVPKAPK